MMTRCRALLFLLLLGTVLTRIVTISISADDEPVPDANPAREWPFSFYAIDMDDVLAVIEYPKYQPGEPRPIGPPMPMYPLPQFTCIANLAARGNVAAIADLTKICLDHRLSMLHTITAATLGHVPSMRRLTCIWTETESVEGYFRDYFDGVIRDASSLRRRAKQLCDAFGADDRDEEPDAAAVEACRKKAAR